VGTFDDVRSILPREVWDGILARSVHGDRLTLGIVELEPGAQAREHSHDHEQIGLVLQGTIDFRIGDERKTLGPGATYVIPRTSRTRRPRGGGHRRHRRVRARARRSGGTWTPPSSASPAGPDVSVELRDVAPGLWIWRQPHPDWREGLDWEPLVTSTCVESRGEVALLDPLAPPEDAADVWERLDARPPTLVAVLKPDHVRDVDVSSAATAHGLRPARLLPRRHPGTQLERDLARRGAARRPAPAVRRPQPRRDAALAPRAARARLRRRAHGTGGELRIWGTPWHEQAVLPASGAMLELPFELVIVAHGEPVHDRAAFERALVREPWS
jgi:hypothetical protein